MLRKISYLCAAAAVALAFQAQSAGARTLHVGTCKTTHNSYTTIQQAVDAAADGDAVSICPGDYPEQVSITKSVSLKGVPGMDAPRITIPGGGLAQNTTMANGYAMAAQILVAPSSVGSANITGLVVDAADNNNADCNLGMTGIYYKNAGGLIRNNTVQNQIGPDGHQGCQVRYSILVENATVGTGEVTINNNRVQNFGKNGIVMQLAGAVGTISRNTVSGLGHTDLIAQNGIELAHGATANITSNIVSGFVFTPETFGSAGIILYDLSSAVYQSPPTVQRNVVSDAQFGIVLDGVDGTVSDMVQVSKNTVSNVEWAGVGIYSETALPTAVNGDYVNVANNKITTTTIYDGIDVCGDNNTITHNTVANSTTESAIHLDALCEQANGDPSGAANTVSQNRITTACIGILSGGSDGDNTIGPNKFVDVQTQTMFGSDDYTCNNAARAPRHHDKKGKALPRSALLSPGRR